MPSSSCFIWKPPGVTERWRVFTQLPPVWLWIIETTTGLLMGLSKACARNSALDDVRTGRPSQSTWLTTSTQSKPVEWSQEEQP